MAERMGATFENGIFRKGDVRISDLSGQKILPVGNDVFPQCVANSVFVDKSLLIADVLKGGNASTLYCRPRRFGKSLNLSMLKSFFEMPIEGDAESADAPELFKGLKIWDEEGGRYRAHCQAYPVIRLSLNNVKAAEWDTAFGMMRNCIASEYGRHGYLAESDALGDFERQYIKTITEGAPSDAELASSLVNLSRYLKKHHGTAPVILIDEYDAPIMAGRTHGYYEQAVSFVKMWLTGALKSNDALSFAVLTGVQRISKESIFSDLNNLIVNTSLNVASDERYGFTEAEVAALAEYCGEEAGIDELRAWYDGYRFGNVDVYNPWSVLNYLRSGCVADVYWGNTSSNSVLGDMLRGADNRTLQKVYQLMEPQGSVREALDLGVVFGDAGIEPGGLWSMLYLAGYLTTRDTEKPNDRGVRRNLFIPNREIARLYQTEIVDRFAHISGDRDRLSWLHEALAAGHIEEVAEVLESILLRSVSFFDLERENSYHMLMTGLLFGMEGYRDPVSNREAGRGRFDIALAPMDADRNPVIVLELKHDGSAKPDEESLAALAEEALAQISEKAYEAALPVGTAGALRYGLAFAGKHLSIAMARA